MKKICCVSILFLLLSLPAISKGCRIGSQWSSPSNAIQAIISWEDTVRVPAPDSIFHVQVYFYDCMGSPPPTVVLMIKDPQGIVHTSTIGHYDFTLPGEYKIYEFEDQPYNLKVTFFVAFTQNATSSVIENKTNTISIHPNPFADQLTVTMKEGNTKELQVRLFSLDGRLVLEHKYTDISSCTLVTFALIPGIYIAEIRTKETTVKQKILKTGS
jgi:hypothetical protein